MIEKYTDIRKMFYKNDNTQYDISDETLLSTLIFNSSTEFKNAELANKILEYGKEPPIGIKELHELGLTGKGVNVAIIDQPLALNHPEYKGKIIDYKFFGAEKGNGNTVSSMHGPAVASLLVGESCGVAPSAKVLYAAAPAWLGDTHYEAEALLWIIDYNEKLGENDKIKFVSVSAAPSGMGSPRKKNLKEWDKAVELANKNGMVVVDCTQSYGFLRSCYIDYKTKQFKKGSPEKEYFSSINENKVFVPTSLRTVAESYDDKNFGYAYFGVGGLSWGIPYAVGLLAIGQQLNPNASAQELKNVLIETCQDSIISPKMFIEKVITMNDENSL